MANTESGQIPRLFGTDGVRGTAGRYPLDPATVRRLGSAIVRALPHGTESPKFLVGRDTRASGPDLETALVAGLMGGGSSVVRGGVLPTPAVALLAEHGGAVISASHNPWQDNGIKVFGHDGYKLPDEQELEIEGEIFRLLADPAFSSQASTKPLPVQSSHRHDYEAFLRLVVPGLSLNGKSVVLDCANGAASAIAPELFATLGGTLSLSLLNGFSPSPTDTFTVLTAGGGLANAFSNVANNGILFADVGVGSFKVNYGANSLILSEFSPIPEPSTWVMIGFGAAAVLCQAWRRSRRAA